jgi:Polyketide cyclase / dehydrase and lipid transport
MSKRKFMIVIYTILGIVALFLIAALFIKKEYSIKREITINRPNSVVYDYLRQFKNHKTFNAWYLKDINMKETTKGTDGQIGFVLSYEGKKDLGSGEQELIGLEQNKKIDIELRFIKPFKSISQTPYELVTLGTNQTKVVWTMNGKMNYPLNIALLFINMDEFLGKDVQKSLENLKVNLEK